MKNIKTGPEGKVYSTHRHEQTERYTAQRDKTRRKGIQHRETRPCGKVDSTERQEMYTVRET